MFICSKLVIFWRNDLWRTFTIFSTGSSLNIVFFPRILKSLPPLPVQHSAAIGCTKNYQPIGVYSRIALKALKVSYSDAGEGGVAVKKHNNSWTPCISKCGVLSYFFFVLHSLHWCLNVTHTHTPGPPVKTSQ